MDSIEKRYSYSDLECFNKISVHQIFESPIWSEERFQETGLDFDNIDKSLLFLSVFAKIVSCDNQLYHVQIIKILSRITGQKFFTHLCSLLCGIETRSPTANEKWLEILENILTVLQQLCSKIPSVALDCLGLCAHSRSAIIRLILSSSSDTLNNRLSNIKDEIEAIQKSLSDKAVKSHIEQRKEKKDQRKPPNDFRKIPIVPSWDDIFHEPFLRKNLTKGYYDNLDHYLDIQFRLLREDCIAQLRSGIFEYIKTKALNKNKEIKKLQDAKLYKNVIIVSKESCTDGYLYNIKLDENHVSRINWEKSKRLLFGSLLCMSPDNFQTLYFAVIENIDYERIKKECTLKIKMRRQDKSDVPMHIPMTMVESAAYFESYRHVLSSIQNIYDGDLPFRRYLLEGRKNIYPPLYVQDNTDIEYDFGPIISGGYIYKRSSESNEDCRLYKLNSNYWPSPDELSLDESQYKALQCALTRELVIIQGPPGTAKTHVGLMIAKCLLHNRKHWMNEQKINEEFPTFKNNFIETEPFSETSSAMLVVCYTNHALDQFIEGIMKFLDPENKGQWGPKLVRVGSRCSNPTVETFNLKYKRRRLAGLKIDEKGFLIQLKESHERMLKIKWMLKKSYENIFGEKILMDWVKEVKTLAGSENEFNMLEWLEIDCDSLCQSTLKDYVESEITTSAKSKRIIKTVHDEDEEKIDMETEAERINKERYIDDEDYDICTDFEEIGVSFELIADTVLKNGDFDEMFTNLLKERIRKGKNDILKDDVMTKTEVKEFLSRPCRIPLGQRWRMYRYFIQQIRRKAEHLLREEKIKYEEISIKYAREKQKIDREILSHSAIIAMTTSGAARYQDVLRDIGPRIIIVEEAAEVLEAHIITTLNSYCEHLILIGDHKQLEPKPAVFELARKYHLDLSMFERMINLGLPYVCLERQHRMRPEISQLVRPVYKRLVDNENVLEYENILGIEKNVYFVSHNAEELTKEDTQTYSNEHEVLFIERLTRYLLKQGYDTRQITVLTPYSGQMILIRNRMPRSEFEGIRISILDNYQGEENDIILLSLVRSNREGKIGFLDKENRVCVALSRAKIGLYVIGNFDFIQKFSYKCKLWKYVIKILKQSGALGKGVPLVCRNHKSTCMQAVNHEDFDKVPEGGCSLKCDFRLKCGHVCNLYCHPRDPRHIEITCEKQCSMQCERGHDCKRRCHFPEDCKCSIEVKKCLPCDHILTLACHINPKTVRCKTQVSKDLPCGHIGVMCCFEDPIQHTCNVLIQRILKCGHHCMLLCHVDHEKYKCKELVIKELPCEHEAEMYCSESPQKYKCREIVQRMLSCKHEIKLECHVDVEKYQCKQMVTKKLYCGHEAELPCYMSVVGYKCMEDVTEKRNVGLLRGSSLTLAKRISALKLKNSCNHFYTRKCYELPSTYQKTNPCKELIKRKLDCEHEIEIACNQQQEPVRCMEMVMSEFHCHHENVPIPCYKKYIAHCQSMCGKMCTAEHICQQVCHHPEPCVCTVQVKKAKLCGHLLSVKCCEDISTIKCEEPVEKRLPCGHIKTLACKTDIEEDDIQCEVQVLKNLKCNHFIDLPCYVNPCDANIKCWKETTKTIPSCGHNVLIECYRDPAHVRCEEMVKVVRPDCGHGTEIFCCLKAAGDRLSPCKTSVIVKLVCGHTLTTVCSEQEAKNVCCMQPCKSYLLCGHPCQGSCSECENNFQHKECEKVCEKFLICGHQCLSSTCGYCGPCFNICSLGCPHYACVHPCFQACETCVNPCDWKCAHYKCSKQCFEVCNRAKCNERCIKKLICGHQCIGFCGDPCPRLCKRCDRIKLEKISNLKSTLFVELQDCGHIFDSKCIDSYMESIGEFFALKRCPKCSSVVRWHPRYNVELKKQRLILNMIRNQVELTTVKLNFPAFPALISDGEDCLHYIAKFGTFLSAKENSLLQTNFKLLSSAKSIISSLRCLIANNQPGNQTFQSIYAKMGVTSALWKLFIGILCNIYSHKADMKLGQIEQETYENVVTDDGQIPPPDMELQKQQQSKKDGEQHLSEYEKFKQNFEHIQKFFVPLQMENNRWPEEILEKLQYFTPFLTNIGMTWTQAADKFPKLVGVVDIHASTWKICENGHPFSTIKKMGKCLFGCGHDGLFLQPLQQLRGKGRPQQRDKSGQGARLKTKINDKETVVKLQKSPKTELCRPSHNNDTQTKVKEIGQGYLPLNPIKNRGQSIEERKTKYSKKRKQRTIDSVPFVFENYVGSIQQRKQPTKRDTLTRFSRGHGYDSPNSSIQKDEFPVLEKRETSHNFGFHSQTFQLERKPARDFTPFTLERDQCKQKDPHGKWSRNMNFKKKDDNI